MFSRFGISPALWCLCLAPLLANCGAGPYGFSKTYAHASGELDAAEGAKEYDPVMAKRKFHEWAGKKVTLFGVVKSRDKRADGSADLALSLRTRQARNLCMNRDEETCRVTVTDHEFGTVHASVKLRAEDEVGELSVSPGSLVRIIGTVDNEEHARTSNPVISAQYYRHWPAKYYVTTKERQFMRQ